MVLYCSPISLGCPPWGEYIESAETWELLLLRPLLRRGASPAATWSADGHALAMQWPCMHNMAVNKLSNIYILVYLCSPYICVYLADNVLKTYIYIINMNVYICRYICVFPIAYFLLLIALAFFVHTWDGREWVAWDWCLCQVAVCIETSNEWQ